MSPFTREARRRGRAAVTVARTALLLGAALCAGCRDGSEAGDNRSAPQPPAHGVSPAGFWFEARERSDVDLGHLGYAEGTRPALPDAPTGIETLEPAASVPGWNLYCSGHAPEARLLDAEGRTRHVWSVDYASLAGVPPLKHPTQRAWRRVRMLPDGGLLALHEALVLLRLDADSRMRWSVGLGAHHDFDIDADGNVHLLTRRAVEHPSIAAGRTIVDDGVAVVSPTGEVLRQASLLEALASSPWAYLLEEAAQQPNGREIDPGDGLARDLLHVNSYALLGADAAQYVGAPEGVFRPGRALICMREVDCLAVLDLDEGRIVWLWRGAVDGPHDPEFDPATGLVWVFDNGLHRGWSRALAVDVATGREVRQWPASPDLRFHSEVCGALQLLPGGNLLLTESTAGRAFEVTDAGRVVWSFGSPHRVAGPNGPLVGCLFELERIPVEDVPAGLRAAPASAPQPQK
ncbi:MAG: arylsulfotransferase family protein [Planctomycetota bacterium]